MITRPSRFRFALFHAFAAAAILWLALAPSASYGQESAMPDAAPAPIAPAASPPAAAASTPAADTSPERALLERLSRSFNRIKSAKATFRQTRYSNIFLESRDFEGAFYVAKPRKFRLEYTAGEESQTIYLGDVAYAYVPEYKQVDKIAVSPEAGSVEALNLSLLGFDLKVESVFAVYSVAIEEKKETEKGTLWTVKMVPLQPDRSPVSSLSLDVLEIQPAPRAGAASEGTTPPAAPETDFRLSRLFFEEASGDTAEMFIQSLDIDVDLDPALFVPKYPDDVEILEN